ncbi:MFS transporter [Streptomyces sp. S07_1.15]|uniref:MFS transporter n=1 Tax=Streptomyces sp. S07_1.15 TaxID=2873925 RepID=UPI001D13614E|nr:MFS transporter [Streptomyces sp. S07_1.15]MCC3652087.1 MFS transporter [Streptomyces sp. S07_1.15]
MSPADTGASAVIRAGAADPTSPSAPGPSAPRPDSGADSGAGADATGLHPGGPGYRRLSLALFAAGVATFALLYSTQALLPAISADLRVTPDAASWTVSGATLGLALAVLPLSALSERFGRRALMTGSLTAAALIALAVPFAPDLASLVALRTVQGVALAGVPASAMAFLAEEVRAKALVGAVGLFVAGNSIGGMSGRIVTGWVAQLWGWRAALGAIALLAVVCTAVFRLLVPRAAHFTPVKAGPRALLRTVGGHLSDPLLCRLYAIGALFMTVFGAVYTVIGYRLADEPFGLPQGIAGSVFLIYLVGTAASATAGRLVARLGRRGALYAAVVTTAAGLLVSLADAIAAVLAGLVLVTAGFFAGHAVASSSVSRSARTGRAQASALYQAAYYVGSSAGGAVGALAYHAAGWPGTVALGLLAVVTAAGITVYATRRALAERRCRAAHPAAYARS